MKEIVKYFGIFLIGMIATILSAATSFWLIGIGHSVEGNWAWINYVQTVTGVMGCLFSLVLLSLSVVMADELSDVEEGGAE